MSDPVIRNDWKGRAIRAEHDREELAAKLYHYSIAGAISALIAVASLLFALVK